LDNLIGTKAKLSLPAGIVSDSKGNLFVLDQGNNRIRMIAATSNAVSTFAGNGNANTVDGKGTTTASFRALNSIAIDKYDNLYVSQAIQGQSFIRMITPDTVVTTIAKYATEDPTCINCDLINYPKGIAVDVTGNLFVSMGLGNQIVQITPTTYTISPALPAGLVFNGATGSISGTPTAVQANTTYEITAKNVMGLSKTTISISVYNPNLPPKISYTNTSFTFSTNSSINPLTPTITDGNVGSDKSYNVSTFAGTGVQGVATGSLATAQFNKPRGIVINSNGDFIVSDRVGHRLRKIDITADKVSIYGGDGTADLKDGSLASAQFAEPSGMAYDRKGNLFVADYRYNSIRKIDGNGKVTTFAGSKTPGNINANSSFASFTNPTDVAINANGDLFIADNGNNCIRKIDVVAAVTEFAGSDTPGLTNNRGIFAKFDHPTGLAFDGNGNLFVADNGNNCIRKIDVNGNVSTFAGGTANTPGLIDATGTNAKFKNPMYLTVDASGSIFVTDFNNNAIRKITVDGSVTTVAGLTGVQGVQDGNSTIATFYQPSGIVIDSTGVLYVADEGNNKIRSIRPLGGFYISPALPAGLTFNTMTGEISGTPTRAGTTTHKITAFNNVNKGSTYITIIVR
jgi:streptogramin lyase